MSAGFLLGEFHIRKVSASNYSLDVKVFDTYPMYENKLQGVHKILCFFLKMKEFFLTLSVLLQRWCSTCHYVVRVHNA